MTNTEELLAYLEQNSAVHTKWFINESELDDEQYELLQLKDDNYLVKGCAGSGKTIIAIHKFLSKIRDSEKASFVVYTITLKDFIQGCSYEMSIYDNSIDYESLLEEKIFYLKEYLKSNDIFKCNFLLIDEVQDISGNKLTNILNLFEGNYMLFGDDEQQIFGDFNNSITLEEIREIASIKKENVYTLEYNYRLPKKIARFAGKIINDNGILETKCKNADGVYPYIKRFNNIDEEIQFIVDMIEREKLTDVGILVPYNEHVKQVKESILEFKNIKPDYKYIEKEEEKNIHVVKDLNSITPSPKIMTYHSSKGLQFEHVFLPMCEAEFIDKYKKSNWDRALYVAVTRATKMVYITYSNKLSEYIPIEEVNNQ